MLHSGRYEHEWSDMNSSAFRSPETFFRSSGWMDVGTWREVDDSRVEFAVTG